MKIFITGIAGFLGSHLAERFVSKGHEVAGCDNLIGGYRDNVPSECSFFEIDCRNLSELSEKMRGAEIVYNTACTAYEGLSVFSPSLIVENTMQISVNAMTAAIQNKVQRFVHCSSMARYGAQEVTPFTEDMVPKPQDPYGIAKYSAELMLTNLSEVHGIDLVIAVPHNIIGPRQKYNDPFRNVASIMANLMLQGRQPIIYGDGSQVRCFSPIQDDLECLETLAFDPRAIGQIFNIGPDDQEITILHLAELIARQLNFGLDPKFLPDRPQEVKHATCSADKIRSYFGYEKNTDLEVSLSEMIDYIRKRGPADFEYHLPIEIVNEKTPESWSKKLF
jgi:UDP-glucose 4-epimerase